MNQLALDLARRMGIFGLPEQYLFHARDAAFATLENFLDRMVSGEWGMMENFYTDVILKDARADSVVEIRDLKLLEPVTRGAVTSIIVAAQSRYGITLMITETFRSKARQEHLFAQKATQIEKDGVHHYGLACDFCKVVDGKASWDGDWTFLGLLAREYGLVWGGDWGEPDKPHTFRDSDHVQRVAVCDQPRLFAGEWYPGADYSPYGTGSVS